jgi:predicted dehydrogenase
MSAHRVLVVGVGSIGERHLRCFAATGRAQVSFCEVNESLRRAVAERYHVSGFASLDKALSGGRQPPERPLDAIVVATPAHLHVPIALRCVRAGCHVLIEKPLAVTTDEVDVLLRELPARGRVGAVGYVYRAHPALAALRRAVRSGRFGEPLELVATCGQHFPFYRPAYRDTYYVDRATGGGAVQDALTHVLNAAEWLIGPPDRVVADCDHFVLEGVQVEDTVHVLTRHGRRMGCFSLNQHQAPNEVTVTVVCERGTARFEGHHNRWRWQSAPDGAWQDENFPALERDTLFVHQAENFLDAIEGKAEPLCTVREAAGTLDGNRAILRSAEERAWVTVQGANQP